MKNDMPDYKSASPIYRDHIKRIIDLLIAIPFGLICVIPMCIVAILIKLDSPGPVFFKQDRIGKDGKVFKMIKFRSMCVGAEQQGTGVYSGKGDARVTRIGRIIRATSIDELPQLINVLRGDMALLGPRAPLTYHPWPIEEYSEEQLHMFDVRPGFSGWAQINGRKDVEWNHRIELNVWYVRHCRFSLDVKIFLMTIFKVLTFADNENKGETLKKDDRNPLKLMYITNNPEVAKIAENAGVDRIFIDMEFIGKAARQGGMDTVQNHHTIEDIKAVKNVLDKAEVMVRINPIHKGYEGYMDTKDEIDAAIEAGADILMLPYFKTADELREFVSCVDGRVKTLPLLESKSAYDNLDEILEVGGVDAFHIGINDMSLDMNRKFMFELLADGTVDAICNAMKNKGIPYGFGGIGRLGQGAVPAEYIIKEHYRLGSSCAILSRSFCNTSIITDLGEIEAMFNEGIKAIREYERTCTEGFEENRIEFVRLVEEFVEGL